MYTKRLAKRTSNQKSSKSKQSPVPIKIFANRTTAIAEVNHQIFLNDAEIARNWARDAEAEAAGTGLVATAAQPESGGAALRFCFCFCLALWACMDVVLVSVIG
jgi:hypothetical protein